jgi:hypothetical protein
LRPIDQSFNRRCRADNLGPFNQVSGGDVARFGAGATNPYPPAVFDKLLDEFVEGGKAIGL